MTGKNNHLSARKDWEDVKDGIMRAAIWLKLSQNKGLGAELLATGNRTLISEDRDPYWGCGPDESGENRLGLLLIHVLDNILKH